MFGQRLPIIAKRSPGRSEHVLVQCPDGRRQAIAWAATSLSTAPTTLDDAALRPPRPISVRTLVPLAQLVRVLKGRGAEVPDASGCPSSSTVETPGGGAAAAPTAALGGPAARVPAAAGTAARRARPTATPPSTASGGQP